MANKGIDYSRGTSNIDTATGIHYGVINMTNLSHWAWNDFESVYGPPTCPKCGGDITEYDDEKHGGYDQGYGCDDYACDACGISFDSSNAFGDEPLGYECSDQDYTATVATYNDCFVTKSPYYTRASFCSPCAPGACSLRSPCFEGEKAYCFDASWFEAGECPYPIWRVADDSLVYPPTLEGLALLRAAIEGDAVAEQAFQDYLSENLID